MNTTEKLLNALVNDEDVSDIEAVKKKDRILKRTCLGEACDDIETNTTEEKLLKKLNEKVCSGGGGSSGGEGSTDMLQMKVDGTKSCAYLFKGYTGENVDFLSNLNTSEVTDMNNMFANTTQIQTIPKINTSNVTNMSYMFYKGSVTHIPNIDTSKAVTMAQMFGYNSNLLSIPNISFENVTDVSQFARSCINLVDVPSEINAPKIKSLDSMFLGCLKLKYLPKINTENITDFTYYAKGCYELETVPEINLIKAVYVSSMFYYCKSLQNLTLLNVKINLTIGSGVLYGHLLTLDSLLNTIKELIDTGSSKTLTMGSANLDKLANVYVKLTGEAEEDESNPKLPFAVCESTDEGAMLITDYVMLKNWALA